ncbi:unnamed protein product, partial [Pocillopora meandrina]
KACPIKEKSCKNRVVSLLHILAYFRSQKTSALQRDGELCAFSGGMSLQGLSAGQLLGYSTTHRSIQQWKVDFCNQHAAFISKQLQRANEVSLSFVKQHVLMHTNIVHMAFCLADIHPTIHAVP